MEIENRLANPHVEKISEKRENLSNYQVMNENYNSLVTPSFGDLHKISEKCQNQQSENYEPIVKKPSKTKDSPLKSNNNIPDFEKKPNLIQTTVFQCEFCDHKTAKFHWLVFCKMFKSL